MSTFLNVEKLGFTYLSGDLPQGLLLTEQFDHAAFLIFTRFEKFAVCLEPASGFKAFALHEVNNAWRGCFATEVQLQADISSGFTSAEDDVRPGDLVVHDGGTFVATRPVQRGHLPRLIRWADAAVLGSGNLKGGFSRWRVIHTEHEVVQVLKEVNTRITVTDTETGLR